MDGNENVVKDWEEKLFCLIEGYSPSDIYNADEAGLFYDNPTKYFVIEMKSISVENKNNDYNFACG